MTTWSLTLASDCGRATTGSSPTAYSPMPPSQPLRQPDHAICGLPREPGVLGTRRDAERRRTVRRYLAARRSTGISSLMLAGRCGAGAGLLGRRDARQIRRLSGIRRGWLPSRLQRESPRYRQFDHGLGSIGTTWTMISIDKQRSARHERQHRDRHGRVLRSQSFRKERSRSLSAVKNARPSRSLADKRRGRQSATSFDRRSSRRRFTRLEER
jgi:hypothetical protein